MEARACALAAELGVEVSVLRIGNIAGFDVIAALMKAPNLPDVLNIAQPGPIEMGALLQAAGRDFATVPAPDAAIAEVALDLGRLSGFLAPKMQLHVADPAQMVAEMALLAPYMKEDPRP